MKLVDYLLNVLATGILLLIGVGVVVSTMEGLL